MRFCKPIPVTRCVVRQPCGGTNSYWPIIHCWATLAVHAAFGLLRRPDGSVQPAIYGSIAGDLEVRP